MLESRRDPNQLKANRYQSLRNYQPSNIAKAAYKAAAFGVPLGNSGNAKVDKRYSVVSLWSMVAENDVEVDDELTKGTFFFIILFSENKYPRNLCRKKFFMLLIQ